MDEQEKKQALTDYTDIDPNTGKILTLLKWDAEKKKYLPTTRECLTIWELHIYEGSARLRAWAIENAKKMKGYQ